MIILTSEELEFATKHVQTWHTSAEAVGANTEANTVSGNLGVLQKKLDNICGTIAAGKLVGIPYSKLNWMEFETRFENNILPSGQTFASCVTNWPSGALLKNQYAKDLGADIYPLFYKIHPDTYDYLGYATHEELYSSLDNYRNLSGLWYFRTQGELHKDIFYANNF